MMETLAVGKLRLHTYMSMKINGLAKNGNLKKGSKLAA